MSISVAGLAVGLGVGMRAAVAGRGVTVVAVSGYHKCHKSVTCCKCFLLTHVCLAVTNLKLYF